MKEITLVEYKKAIEVVKQFEKLSQENYKLIKKNPSSHIITKDTMIVNIQTMSYRLLRCLRWYFNENGTINLDEVNLSDLEGVSASRLLKTRTLGVGTLDELKRYCARAGVNLTQ